MKKLLLLILLYSTIIFSIELNAQEVKLVKDLIEGPDDGLDSDSEILGSIGNFIVIENRGEILVSNGTSEGTSVIGDVGTEGRILYARTILNEKLYIIVDNDDNDYSVVEIDTVGPSMKTILTDFDEITNLLSYNGKLYCDVDNDQFGTAFISVDPTTGNTEEIFPVAWFGGMRASVVHNDLIYTIHYSDTQDGAFLSSSDGTPGNVNEFKFLYEGSDFSQTSSINMTSAGDHLYFWYYADNESLYNFYRSDGTESGTEVIYDNFERIAFYEHRKVRAIGTLGNSILFLAKEMDEFERHLWISDGSQAGTCKIELAGPDIPVEPIFFSAFNDELYFFGVHEEGAWSNQSGIIKSDATKNGTTLAFNGGEHEDQIYYNGWHLVSHREKLYFSANGSEQGSELYESLGTVETTHRISDIGEGDESSAVFNLVSAGDNLFFYGNDDKFGRELYVLNNTISTIKELDVLSADVFPNPASDLIQVQGLESSIHNYRIMDVTGEIIKKGEISNLNEINISNFNAGMYFLNLSNEEQVYRAKFFKK